MVEAFFPFSLCADDFALSPGISRGICEALAAGRLSAASVMTTRPFWPGGAGELRQSAERADIGLHLNLTLGGPLGPMPAFAPSGRFPALGQVVKAALQRQLPEAEIGAEMGRQIEKFSVHFDAAPAFVDGHQHVQILPQIRSLLFACLDRQGLAGKVWLRDSSDRPWRILRRRAEVPKALGISWLARGFAREAAARGYVTNEGFSGFSAFDPGDDYAAAFARYLRAPGRRHLVMCHPGYCDAELALIDRVTSTREQELRFILSPAFLEAIEQSGARLVRLSAAALGRQRQTTPR